MQTSNIIPVCLSFTLLTTFNNELARAQSKPVKTPTFTFLDSEVSRMEGIFAVIKDANVRIQPATKGRRIGRRARGQRVRVVGKAKGNWLAIRDENNNDIGFIYRSILMPIINGALETPLFGRLFLTNGVSCSYRIQFDGKSAAKDQVFEFADYQIKWQCVLGKSTLVFKTPMFLTEGPFRGTSNRLHQITIDILGLAGNMDSVLSTHILWDREQAQVKFDSVTIEQFVRPSKVKAIRANNVTEALHGSIKIAAKAWNGPLWDAIIRTHKNTKN